MKSAYIYQLFKNKKIKFLLPLRSWLVLVGTIASDNPDVKRAIIETRRMKQQVAYREGEKVAEVRVKKILREKVIIQTDDENKLLTVEHKPGCQIANIDKDKMVPEAD